MQMYERDVFVYIEEVSTSLRTGTMLTRKASFRGIRFAKLYVRRRQLPKSGHVIHASGIGNGAIMSYLE